MRSEEVKTQKQPKAQNSKLKTLKDIGEFGLIKRISQRSRKRDLSVLIGIGDDAAAINVGAALRGRPQKGTHIEKGTHIGVPLLVTTDSLVEDIHFKRSYPPEDIGWKALAVNISDIAAMGGVPKYYLLSLSIPERVSVEYIDLFYSGMAGAARKYGLSLIGGDTTASPDRIYISITVIGKAGEIVLLRKGARPGDAIFVTGTVGDSALGLKILEEHTPPLPPLTKGGMGGWLINRHLRPTPRLKEGAFLAKSGIVTSMIDISDGLVADMGHICEESRVGARIYAGKLPLSAGFRAVSGKYGGMELALVGGEDYELLFTVSSENVENFMRRSKGIKYTQIGEITKGKGVQVIGTGGERYVPTSGGYEHFKG